MVDTITESVSEKLLNIHCEKCGAPVKYNIEKKTYACEYCGSKLNIDAAKEQKKGFRALQQKKLEAEGKNFKAISASCDSCGASLVFPSEEAVEKCSFCGSNLVRSKYLKINEFPELIIPFGITLKEAKEILEEWAIHHQSIPEARKVKNNIQHLQGYYLPYELLKGPIHSRVSRNSSLRSFTCEGELDHAFVNTTSQLDNLTLNGMEPFDLEELQEFDFGYIADKKVKINNLEQKQLESRISSEVEFEYTPVLEKTLETKNLYVKCETDDLFRLPVLLPVYFISQRNLKVAINGQTGKVAVKSEKIRKSMPWWIYPIVLTLLTFLIAFGITYYYTKDTYSGFYIGGMFTLVMGLIFYTAYSNEYESSGRKYLPPKIYTSSQLFQRDENLQLKKRTNPITSKSIEPIFYETIDGVYQKVKVKFTTFFRTMKTLFWCFVFLFLPYIIAFVLNGFKFQGMAFGGGAVWLSIFVIIVPAYFVKLGRIDIYENPYIYALKNGKYRRVKLKSNTVTVLEVIETLFFSPLFLAGLFLLLTLVMDVYLIVYD